jgi:Transposase DDE domain
MKAARKLRSLQQPQSLIGCVRQFLTPTVWKQARHAVPRRRCAPRWDLQPLILIMLAMTWATGDSQAEKFAKARGFYVACHATRKRPGTTLIGFQKALRRTPMRQLRALAAGVRQEIGARLGARRLVDGFEPMGCDGSRIECPRTPELERGLGQAGKTDAAPNVWLTAFVHLPTGLLWSWRLGPGTAAEQVHLRFLLVTLSPEALIVCDAAYMGFELVRAIVGSRRSFLFRMSSRVDLYTLENVSLEGWTEGLVLYWPKYVQKKGLAPIRCRLIRVPAKAKAKTKGNAKSAVKRDVWLLTDVLDPARLSVTTAAKFYRWRWRNEGLFRTYKRTINTLKLTSRTLGLVHREAELSLLATQILLAHAELALRPETTATTDGPVISPRKVLIEIRKEIDAAAKPKVKSYRDRLAGCRAEGRTQISPKSAREWPRRKPHKPPKPPVLHTLSDEQKAMLDQHMGAVG